MALKLASTEGMSHVEWLAIRKTGIGGSDAAAACGLSRWKSPVELWMEKTGQKDSPEAGEAAYWGTVMEPLIRSEFTKRTGLSVQIIPAILRHPEHTFMIANLDGAVVDPDTGRKGIFEAKTAGVYAAGEWADGLPDEYALQIQHYMAVTGALFAYVAVLIGGNRFQWQRVDRNQEVIKLLIQLESNFWKLVETKTPPPYDGSKSSTDLLSLLYPTSNKNSIVLPAEAADLISDFETAQQAEKEAAERKDLAANRLKALLGDNEVGTIQGWEINWKSISSDRIDSKALKLDQPEIYAKYAKTTSYRRFTVK